MADIELKLDQILSNQKEIKERVSNLKDTLNGTSHRLAINENSLSKVEQNQENLQTHVAKLELKIKEMQQENLKQKEDFKLDLLNRELYSKRFNFLIYGLPKDKMFRWETRDQGCHILEKSWKVLDFFSCSGKSLNFVHKPWKVLENIWKVFP